MKIEIGQGEVQEIRLPLEVELPAPGRERDVAALRAINVGGPEGLNKGLCLGDALPERGEASLVIGIFGASKTASRAVVPLAKSVAICTWRVKGNMSGAKRQLSRTLSSILRSLA